MAVDFIIDCLVMFVIFQNLCRVNYARSFISLSLPLSLSLSLSLSLFDLCQLLFVNISYIAKYLKFNNLQTICECAFQT